MKISLLSVLFQFVFLKLIMTILGFSGGSDGTESACNAGELGLIPGSGRPPGEGNGFPLQCSCLENSMDRGVRQATVHGLAELDTTEQLILSLSAKDSDP